MLRDDDLLPYLVPIRSKSSRETPLPLSETLRNHDSGSTQQSICVAPASIAFCKSSLNASASDVIFKLDRSCETTGPGRVRADMAYAKAVKPLPKVQVSKMRRVQQSLLEAS